VTTPDQVHAAIRTARAAQPGWAALGPARRRERLLAFKRIMLDEAESLTALLARETGKPAVEGLTLEIMPGVAAIGFHARHAARALCDRRVGLRLFPHKRSRLRYEPRGVVASITPWNLPLLFFASDVAAALAAGNAAVVKPSEFTPLVALEAKRLLDRAGIPPDLVQVVPGAGAAGAALIDAADPAGRADFVIFTGSAATGRIVGAACASRLIPFVLEHGGNAAAIVRADADVDRAARLIVYGAFANAGQLCVKVNRVFVDARIAGALTDRIVERARALGPEDVGALTTDAQLATVRRHVEDALAHGATVACGGSADAGPGRRFQPTVLTNVAPEMAVMCEETFGPVLPVLAVDGDAEALRLANDSPYGLMGYVFSTDRRRARAVAERLRAGTVITNDVLYTYMATESPWGGLKSSGIGRVHGEDFLRELCETRHLNEERWALPIPWAYPYTAARTRRLFTWARRLLRWFA
jgi:succinate-semialdehyde dehydrogenase/glutarate-semialdehyde dehydrogenase